MIGDTAESLAGRLLDRANPSNNKYFVRISGERKIKRRGRRRQRWRQGAPISTVDTGHRGKDERGRLLITLCGAMALLFTVQMQPRPRAFDRDKFTAHVRPRPGGGNV